MRKLKPVTPGELLLEEFLTPMEISRYRLAKKIGVPAQRIGDIVAGNIISGSMINIGFVSDGRLAMPTRLKSRTITRSRATSGRRGHSQELVGRRLPRHRPPTRPGEMLLEEFVKPLAVTQSELASRLGISFPRLNEIIRGKRAITSDTALRLARVLGMSADFWLGLQLDWDLWHAMRGAKASEIERLAPLRPSA